MLLNTISTLIALQFLNPTFAAKRCHSCVTGFKDQEANERCSEGRNLEVYNCNISIPAYNELIDGLYIGSQRKHLTNTSNVEFVCRVEKYNPSLRMKQKYVIRGCFPKNLIEKQCKLTLSREKDAVCDYCEKDECTPSVAISISKNLLGVYIIIGILKMFV